MFLCSDNPNSDAAQSMSGPGSDKSAAVGPGERSGMPYLVSFVFKFASVRLSHRLHQSGLRDGALGGPRARHAGAAYGVRALIRETAAAL